MMTISRRREDGKLIEGTCPHCKVKHQVHPSIPQGASKELDAYYAKHWPNVDCGQIECMQVCGNPLAKVEA